MSRRRQAPWADRLLLTLFCLFGGATPDGRSAESVLCGYRILMKVFKPKPVNLLEIRPRRNVEWETTEQGHVALMVPKFRNEILARWILPLLSVKHFRVKLDAYGSFIWKQCDGNASIEQIGEKMRAEFGESAEPVYERIGKFLRKLEQEDFVVINAPTVQ